MATTAPVMILEVVKKVNFPRIGSNPFQHHTVEKAPIMAAYKIQKFQKLQANPIKFGDVMVWAIQYVR